MVVGGERRLFLFVAGVSNLEAAMMGEFLVWVYVDAMLAILHNNALGCQPMNLFAQGETGKLVAMRCPMEAFLQAVSSLNDYGELRHLFAQMECLR